MARTDTPNLKESQRKSAVTENSPLMFPGDFKINKLKILSPIRGIDKPIDLNTPDSNWLELNFYEDIYSSTVAGDLTIQEGMGLIEAVPIVGEEILEVTFSTAGALPSPIGVANAQDDIPVTELPKIVTNRFRIYKVDPPTRITDNFRSIKFYFISDIAITNMMVKVQKNYPTSEIVDVRKPENPAEDKTYSIADMVRDIFYDCFIGKKKPQNHRPTGKNLLVEPTKGPYYASIPNWTPFKAINFLSTRALSNNKVSNGANFVFYETLKGFRFVSIETLMMGGFRGYDLLAPEESKFPHYKTFPTETAAKGTSGVENSYIPVYDDNNFTPVDQDPIKKPYVAVYTFRPGNIKGLSKEEQYYSVTQFNLMHTFDSLKSLGMGMYANRVITHDLVRMKWSKNDFHYIPPSDVVTFVDQSTGAETETTNQEQPSIDSEVLPDNFVKADFGKVCSNGADMLGRPESHISLFPTNKGIYTKLADGIRKTTYVDGNGDLAIGGDFTAKTVNGSDPEANPKENEKRVEEWLAQRIAQRQLLDTVKLQFSVPGDSAREVGDLIWFQYPSENPEPAETTGLVEPHKYFSGKYLITALRHKITKEEYTMTIEAVKDGYRSQLSPGFGLNNPRTLDPTGVTDAE